MTSSALRRAAFKGPFAQAAGPGDLAEIAAIME